MTIRTAPSILCADFARLGDKVKNVIAAGVAVPADAMRVALAA